MNPGKWIAVLSALFLALILSACGGGGGNEGDDGISPSDKSSNWDSMKWDRDDWA